MKSNIFSLIGLLLILTMALSTFVVAPPVSAVSTGLVVYSPTADNSTNMAFVKQGGIVSVRYNLQGAGGDSNPMQFHIYPTSGSDIGTAAADRASGAIYVDNVSIAGGSSEGTYNLSVFDGTNPIVVKLGAVKVDNTAPTGSLLSPTASTVWSGAGGAPAQNIYWTSTDAADSTQNVYVTLDYYNGTGWTNIITSQPYAQGQQSYSWAIAGIGVDSTACQTRMYLTDRAGNTSAAIPSPTFTILSTPPTIAITYPDAAGISWTSGQGAYITWTVAGSVATTLNYVLKYDINSGGGGYPYTIATLNGRTRVASDNYSSFTAPYVPYASRNLLKVKVIATDSAGNTGNDTSANDFAVNDTTAPTVTLGAPNGGQNWLAGSVQNITFTMTDLTADNLNYELQYTTNASAGTPIWYAVTGGTGTNVAQGAKTVAWTVPPPAATSTDCKVRVMVTNKYGVASAWIASTGVFTITVSTTPPVVAVITPNGGETLVGGTAYNITYTATDSVSGTFQWLKFEYTLDNGSNWATIATINNAPQAASGSGSFSWSVPNSAATSCRIRVTAHSQTGLETSAQSANLFQITASTFAPQTTNVILYPGWNLISLPLIPVNSNIGGVMAAVSENISSVWYYDTTNGWQSWKPGAPSDLTIMRDGKAYWVQTNQPTGPTHNTTLPVYGRVGPEPPDVMPTYTMASGWNMVGFKSLAPQTASVYLAPLSPTSIYLYDNGGGTGYQRVLTSAPLLTGMGYWVFFGTGGSFAP
jgi:hypothetical protein